ncbi:hypothetical protein RV11_GL001775 [Enterococcus phoeniculicola]|jgi:FMN-dependent NADH-azoreductase|uniref:FMN dependent NADH:quinone oxidoreductase n=1 Tax=Enterococcus phoeniculicola ATCC BAA-412 TaxID=1158610 RepID=R3U1A1_9ENTE|nr:NAD(P)H-dependent oxidoreductase [Enterococcus phoeniculicola]EOL47193.1 hypothetical protein UC3_00724 [Enterococcus phoeniculicola ATCC BAA-412]EOT73015.1 hypothetical protein I589_03286 [Enterococcus phoeniculicola ATCC BAA-412]OJG70063.1 hypothetical protein RV11_GL001775 [Enterococcus phoeniculicola]
MKTLLINAHPDFKQTDSYSAKLQQVFLAAFHKRFPSAHLTYLTLYDTMIPRIEENQLLRVWEKQQKHELLTSSEEVIAKTSSDLLAQFKEHHRIVIVSPLHNFNVSSRLKDYIDNILIARETFKYTDTGSVGLMTDDYRLLYLQASGSVYTNNDRYTPLEFSHYFLKEMFTEIMGFEKFYIVRAQGTALYSADEVLKFLPEEMEATVNQFYD